MRNLSDSSSKARLWAALGIVVLSLLWGYTWVVAKQALDYAPPFTLTDIRNAIPEHCWERNGARRAPPGDVRSGATRSPSRGAEQAQQ